MDKFIEVTNNSYSNRQPVLVNIRHIVRVELRDDTVTLILVDSNLYIKEPIEYINWALGDTLGTMEDYQQSERESNFHKSVLEYKSDQIEYPYSPIPERLRAK